jgi:hypothetical protein
MRSVKWHRYIILFFLVSSLFTNAWWILTITLFSTAVWTATYEVLRTIARCTLLFNWARLCIPGPQTMHHHHSSGWWQYLWQNNSTLVIHNSVLCNQWKTQFFSILVREIMQCVTCHNYLFRSINETLGGLTYRSVSLCFVTVCLGNQTPILHHLPSPTLWNRKDNFHWTIFSY